MRDGKGTNAGQADVRWTCCRMQNKIICGYTIIMEHISEILYKNSEKIHTTEMGIERIKRNLDLDTTSVQDKVRSIKSL